MNIIYAKSVLYAYSAIPSVIEQIDDLVLSRALFSMHDVSPADEQCEKIINLTEQKKTLIYLYKTVKELLEKFTEKELEHLDYKYFRQKPKSHYEEFDYLSRAYFRFQTVVAEKFARKLEQVGITEEWIDKNILPITFFKALVKCVKEKEVLSNKNKPQKNEKKPKFMSSNATKIIDRCTKIDDVDNKAFA